MKNFLVIVLLTGFGLTSQASDLVTRMRPQDRFFIETFVDIWQEIPGDIKSGSIDRGAAISYLYDYPIAKSSFSIAGGIHYTGHNFYSDSHLFSRVDNTNTFDFVELPDGIKVDKAKISLNYLGVPVEFRYFVRTLPKTLRVHLGFKTSYLVNAYNKYEGKDIAGNDYDVKFREYKLDNIQKFVYGVTARLGYGAINVFGYMPLNNIFYDNTAEDMYPISVGISLILF